MMDITSKTRIEDAKKALIEKLTAEYGFEGFLHYTDISNLFRIIDSGYLYARNYVDQRFELDGADETVIDRTPDYIKKYVRFYYKEQTPTLFNNEGIRKDDRKPHMPIPVALLFNKEIIMHRGVFFLNGGGGNLESNDQVLTVRTDDPIKARNFNWKVIMGRTRYGDYKRLMKDYGNKWMEEITNMRNAEFHYPNRIEIGQMDRVIFRSNAELKFAQEELQNRAKVPMFVDETKFTFLRKHSESHNKKEYDINFLNDFFVKVHEDKIDVELMLAYGIDGYEHILRIEQGGGRKSVTLNLLSPASKSAIVSPVGSGFSLRIPCRTDKITAAKYCLNGTEYTLWRRQ